MDPDANLREQEQLLADHAHAVEVGRGISAVSDEDRLRLLELRQALAGWLRGGGFVPDWSLYPRAAAYYGR